MKHIYSIHYLVFALFFPGLLLTLKGQTDSLNVFPKTEKHKLYKVKTKEGTSYTGYILQNDSTGLKVENRNTQQVYTLNQNAVESIEEVRKKSPKLTELYGENPHHHFYILGQSALPLRSQEVDAHYHWLSAEHAEYAFNENWALTINSLLFAPLSLGVKCHYPINDDLHAGINVFGTGNLFSAAATGNSSFFGLFAMGKLTKGYSNQNITLSGGITRLFLSNTIGGLWTQGSNAGILYFASVSGFNRFSAKTGLVGEAWYFPQLQASLSGAGIKLIGNESTSWTFGYYALYFGKDLNFTNLKGRVLPIPYIGYSTRF